MAAQSSTMYLIRSRISIADIRGAIAVLHIPVSMVTVVICKCLPSSSTLQHLLQLKTIELKEIKTVLSSKSKI
jgi:hypothetical protein